VVTRSPAADRLREALEAAGGQVREGGQAGELIVEGLSIERIGELAAANGIVLHELRRETSTLEDAFLRLTGGAA
jgi:ABC-2 type transport system ATP-binding protein